MKPDAAKRSDRQAHDGDYGIGDPILTNRRTFLLDNLNGTCAIVFYWTLDDADYTNV